MDKICGTCYSTLPPSGFPDLYQTPCCNTPICSPCLTRNPRLKEYVPCLRCGDVRSQSGMERIKLGREEVLRKRMAEEQDRFVLGDEEDESPPGYSSDPEAETHSAKALTPNSEAEDEVPEVQTVTHNLCRGDTLLSISRRYAVDPHDLLKLNNLPHSTLTTQPHLLRTRKTLIISQSKAKTRLLHPPASPSDPDMKHPPSEDEDDNDEEKKRAAERQLKRFQLITKTTDPGVGKVYLSLTQLEGPDAVEIDASGEGMDGKKKVPAAGTRTVEERAMERFWDDLDWEREAVGPSRVKEGRWKVVTGSGMERLKA